MLMSKHSTWRYGEECILYFADRSLYGQDKCVLVSEPGGGLEGWGSGQHMAVGAHGWALEGRLGRVCAPTPQSVFKTAML